MENELKIIERCQAGNLADFSLLYDNYAEKIYRFVYFKTSHKEIAQDLTSQAFFKALENIKTFDGQKGCFSSWLYRIARNLVIDHYRAQKNDVDIESVWGLGGGDDLARDSELREKITGVKEFLKKLDEEQQEIIMMRVWDGLSHKEIAQILGRSEASCKMAFCRAIGKLRKEEILVILALGVIIKNFF